MSTADHILDQIDHALGDYSVSDDAMRSRPEPAGPRGKTTMSIMGADGEWQEVGGIATIDIEVDTGGVDQQLARLAARQNTERRVIEIHEALRSFMRGYAEAVRPAIEEFGRQLQAASQAMRSAGLIDDHGKAVRRRDRPAWQSPYGPARRR